MLVEVTCALDVCTHTINQTPLLMSHSHTLLWLFFFFLILFYRPGFRLVPARQLVHPDKKDDLDARRERSAAVSKRQLALASAPERAAAADEMRSRYRTHASGRGGPALAFWQGIVGGPRFFMFTLRFRKLKHEINVDA